ncbi:IS1595 family transposase [Neisseria iguanae]|uniref:IS1595 family transposase n=1 Tax=Neisseria iguanae TaxID=90242 RepID=A0A2P7U2B4_9NEIS|nr:IS1595 family transposase [Neisseria iguanae]PSJ81118.1 IS1595 family transposase [Neisseria iguanae]
MSDGKNKDNHCKLTKNTQRKLLRFFVPEATARAAADILGIQPGWAMLSYRKTRQAAVCHLAQATGGVFRGPTGPDGGCFGGRRKGKRGRVAAGKAAVSGTLKRQGKVGTAVAGDNGKDALFPVVKQQTTPDGIVYTGSDRGCGVLDAGQVRASPLNRSQPFADRQNPIGGIGNCWNRAKCVLRKYNGVGRKPFPLFLKECRFRFDFGTPSGQLEMLREWCGVWG